ncbi:hypothetical protein [Mesorhizobium sp.]|nr:hypothetical protein [Mesorhizobium sp.]
MDHNRKPLYNILILDARKNFMEHVETLTQQDFEKQPIGEF